MKIRVNFFHVAMPDNAEQPFERVLDLVGGIPLGESRNVELWSAPVRLQRLQASTTMRFGEMVKLRMFDIPTKGSTLGPVSSLGLRKNEGVCEETAFLYHRDLNVLALQSRKGAVSPAMFAEYFSLIGGFREDDEAIELLPIINLAAAERLARMGSIRQFEFRVAPIQSGRVTAAVSKALGPTLELKERFGSPIAHIILKVGRYDRPMAAGVTKQVARALRGLDEVDRIRVRGETEEGVDEVDLIRERVRAVVDIGDPGRHVDYERRIAALREAWERHRAEIRVILTGG